MYEHVAIGVEYLGFGHKAQVPSFLIHYRQVPCAGVFKNLHHFLHRQVEPQDSGRRGHELAYREALVQARLEHDVTHLVQQ